MHTVVVGEGVGEGEGEGEGEVEEEEEEWPTFPLEDTLTPRPTARPVCGHKTSNKSGWPKTLR